MPAKRKHERVVGQHFSWLLSVRSGVYQADGRSNKPSPGRHSLNTKSHHDALEILKQLDLVKAVELGLADRTLLDQRSSEFLSLAKGVELYLTHVKRPAVTGGAQPATFKRYRAVFDKFVPYAGGEGYRHWNQVTKSLLEEYAAWLDGEGYAYRTEFLELTTIKQAINWMIEAGHLPASCAIKLPLAKPTGSDTYCWRPEEVEAIVNHCLERPELVWLGQVLTALACTGMRISELASLRWSDIDQARNMIMLTDEGASVRRPGSRKPRQIKNHRSRSFPIHEGLQKVLAALDRNHDGRVFHGPKQGVLSPDIVRRTLVRDVLEPLASKFPTPSGDIGFAAGRLHSFRHYFCSTCANSGVPEQVVMQWLGHQQSAMVRHYYHLHDQEAQKQMKKLNFVGEARRHVDGASNPYFSREVTETISTTWENMTVTTLAVWSDLTVGGADGELSLDGPAKAVDCHTIDTVDCVNQNGSS